MDVKRPSGLIIPGYTQAAASARIWPWLIIYTGPDLRNGGPRPQFFPSHGQNLPTWEAKQKKGEALILGHVLDSTQERTRLKAKAECRKLNDGIPGRREELQSYREKYRRD